MLKNDPETQSPQPIHPATRLGPVSYTVADLERQIAYYRDVLGFKLHWQDGNSAGLGAGGEDLLRLTQQPGARRVRGTTGLYHTAFLVPTRLDLAYLLKSIAETRTRIQGMMDHGTHHAIYLPDAEGNGIELAWDRPKEEWPRSLAEMMQRNRSLLPEEVFSVLGEETPGWDGLDGQTRVGHVHLHVSHLEDTDDFYRKAIGMDIPLGLAWDTAIFFSAGGYHHHIGTNVWQGVGAPPPPPDATGLRSFNIVVPDGDELEKVLARLDDAEVDIQPAEEGYLVRDPAMNGIVLSTRV